MCCIAMHGIAFLLAVVVIATESTQSICRTAAAVAAAIVTQRVLAEAVTGTQHAAAALWPKYGQRCHEQRVRIDNAQDDGGAHEASKLCEEGQIAEKKKDGCTDSGDAPANH